MKDLTKIVFENFTDVVMFTFFEKEGSAIHTQKDCDRLIFKYAKMPLKELAKIIETFPAGHPARAAMDTFMLADEDLRHEVQYGLVEAARINLVESDSEHFGCDYFPEPKDDDEGENAEADEDEDDEDDLEGIDFEDFPLEELVRAIIRAEKKKK